MRCHEDLVVAPNLPPAPIRVVQTVHCGTLSGTVHTQAGDDRGTVLLLPESDRVEPRIVPFGKGRFQISTLSSGTYHVYAFSSLNDLEYANRAVLREYPGQTVRLEKDRHTTVKLELIRRRP